MSRPRQTPSPRWNQTESGRWRLRPAPRRRARSAATFGLGLAAALLAAALAILIPDLIASERPAWFALSLGALAIACGLIGALARWFGTAGWILDPALRECRALGLSGRAFSLERIRGVEVKGRSLLARLICGDAIELIEAPDEPSARALAASIERAIESMREGGEA